MKQYLKTKDSGISWIGQIPDHWMISKLRTCLESNQQKNNDGEIREMLSVSQTLGIIKKEYESDLEKRPNDTSDNYLVVKKNDLVVNKMWIQFRGLAVSNLDGIVSPAYKIFKVDSSKIMPEFLNYLVRSDPFVNEYSKYLRGIRPNSLEIRSYDLIRFPLIIPSENEQKIIVKFLNWKMDIIDSQISNYKILIDYLKIKKQTNVNELITRGITPNTKLKNSDISWIGEIPDHWDVSKLIVALDKSTQRNTDSIERKMLSVSQYLGIIEKEYDSEDSIPSKNDTLRYFVVEPNDLVVNVMWLQFRGLAVSNLDGIVSPDYAVFKTNTNIVFPKYLHYLLRSDIYLNEYPKHLQGIRPNSSRIKKYDFLRIPLILPPLDEQKDISKKLDDLDIVLDNLIIKIKSQMEFFKKYKQILVSQIILGKIDVRPNTK
jgi:type I restriction enzyme, S subunit